MSFLQGKKILLVAPSYFDYEVDIVMELRSLGAYVEYFDERPFSSSFDKFLLRINPKLFRKKIDTYYRESIKSLAESNFDFLLWIKAAVVSRDILKWIRQLIPNAKFILYQWDSVRNNPNCLNVFDLFDDVYSFDPEDCAHFGFSFRPLFFSNRLMLTSKSHKKYDFYCVASIGLHHSDRHVFLSRLKSIIGDKYSCFFKAYCSSKVLYFIRKIRLKLKGVALVPGLVTFKSVPKEEAYESMLASEIVVDFTHSEQVGLPMRIIECLGAQKKLLTNNNAIKNYNFYNQSNIHIFQGVVKESEIEGFRASKMEPYDVKILSNYSLEAWIKEVLKPSFL